MISALARHFEQLCRIRFVSIGNDDRGLRALPEDGACYAFWWTGPVGILRRCERRVVFKGPRGRDVPVMIDDAWLGLTAGAPVPLYVGKTTKLRTRTRKHLLLKQTKRILPRGRATSRQRAPTTTCQLRAGIERLFPNEPDPTGVIRRNVGISFVELPGDKHAADRFFLEDLAIGLMRPPINLDVER